jgi:hypothetical protein
VLGSVSVLLSLPYVAIWDILSASIRQHAQRLAQMFFDPRTAKKAFDTYTPGYASLLPRSSIRPFPTCLHYPSTANISPTSPPPPPEASKRTQRYDLGSRHAFHRVRLWAGVLSEVGSGVE